MDTGSEKVRVAETEDEEGTAMGVEEVGRRRRKQEKMTAVRMIHRK